MTSTSLAYAVEMFSEKLTSSVDVTSVASSINVSAGKITSVLEQASSFQEMNLSQIATVTNEVVIESLQKRNLIAQATINYYSILNDIATATTTSSAQLTQAAQASAIMKTMFADVAFFHGNYPSLGGNIAVGGILCIILVLQVVFGAVYHQYWFLSCWTIGLTMEILGYAGRVWCRFDMFSFNAYVMQMVCVTLAPCFLLAGMYYLLAQLSHIYGEQHSIFRPMIYSYAFIFCDTVSICLQGAGGGLSSGAGTSYQLGINIMVVGLSIQVFTMIIFQYLWYNFLFRIIRAHSQFGDAKFNPEFVHIRSRGWTSQVCYFGAISVAFLLIFVRSIYRLCEMSAGFNSELATNELYFMLLESLMIGLACALMTVFHPGLAYGRNSHIYIDKKFKGFFPAKVEEPEKSYGSYASYEYLASFVMRDTL